MSEIYLNVIEMWPWDCSWSEVISSLASHRQLGGGGGGGVFFIFDEAVFECLLRIKFMSNSCEISTK